MKNFKKYYIINADPELLYNALTNAATIQLWSGEPAVMEAVPGFEFSIFDGSICGRNLEFITNKKIVQEWYFGDQEEASIVTIILHADKNKTSAEVRQTNIPDEDYENIATGWEENYFGALIEFYED
jgi:activator of HSP90 ATPase